MRGMDNVKSRYNYFYRLEDTIITL